MGIIYNNVKNPVKGVEYIQKALAIFKTFEGGCNMECHLLTRVAAGQYFLYVYNSQESGVFPVIIVK